MKVLLTGASGFIGSHIGMALLQQGMEVVTLGRRQPQLPVRHITADLLTVTDFAPLLQEAEATHLLHVAWHTEHGEYWSSLLNLRWVETSVRLVEAFCAVGGKGVAVAGTCAEYDWTHGYCREDGTPLHPATLYGIAKDATRRLVMAICAQHQVPCAWGRIFLPFGQGEDARRLIPSLMDVFRGQRSPFGVNAAAYRDFLHVSDVAAGFVKLLGQGSIGSYNICSGKPVQLSKVVNILANLLGADPQPILAQAAIRLGEPSLLIGENLKLQALGWSPALTLEQGLENFLMQ